MASVFLPDGHQSGHFHLGQADFLPAPAGQGQGRPLYREATGPGEERFFSVFMAFSLSGEAGVICDPGKKDFQARGKERVVFVRTDRPDRSANPRESEVRSRASGLESGCGAFRLVGAPLDDDRHPPASRSGQLRRGPGRDLEDDGGPGTSGRNRLRRRAEGRLSVAHPKLQDPPAAVGQVAPAGFLQHARRPSRPRSPARPAFRRRTAKRSPLPHPRSAATSPRGTCRRSRGSGRVDRSRFISPNPRRSRRKNAAIPGSDPLKFYGPGRGPERKYPDPFRRSPRRTGRPGRRPRSSKTSTFRPGRMSESRPRPGSSGGGGQVSLSPGFRRFR